MLALEEALAIADAQEVWDVQDDLCECVYQRIGYWFNPYIGETLETRLCCVWAKFEQQWPELFRRTKQEPAEWNGESQMPKAIWHRQLANHLGVSVAEARTLGLVPPSGKPRVEKPRIFLPWSGEYMEVVLG